MTVTPEYLRAYWSRPEVHPLDTSCAAETALHAQLLADPLRPVSDGELGAIADPDVVENYQAVLAFREVLTAATTIEGAYLRLIRSSDMAVPPVFMDQMVHLIVRNMLPVAGPDATDPLMMRAAELFFREQAVTRDDTRLLLSDDETVAMLARAGDVGQSQLLIGTPAARHVALDVLTEDNKQSYWTRSDQFDTVLDFSIGEPALDAFSSVMECWLKHMLGIDCRIAPHQKLDDNDWRWHIGLDTEATRMLNTLYEGGSVSADAMSRIVGLFRMQLADNTPVLDRVKGRPVYLGFVMSPKKRLKMQPQNLLINLPLRATS